MMDSNSPFRVPMFILGMLILLVALNIGITEFTDYSSQFAILYAGWQFIFYLAVVFYFLYLLTVAAQAWIKLIEKVPKR